MTKKSKKRTGNKRHGIKPWRQLKFFGKVWRVIWVSIIALWALSLFLVFLYKFINPPITPLMIHRFNQQLLDKDRKVVFERDYVPIENISQNLIDAVVASEDGNFLHHHGFDVRQLKQSYRENKLGRRVRGGSTISMQTAKNAFLPHHRSMLRKAFEAYFTQLIEWVWGKERIMECYLNIIEFGDGIYGCEAAAQHYYGHSAANLSKREAAQLAVTLPSPLKRNPNHTTPKFRSQTEVIIGRTSKYGHIRVENWRKVQARDKEKGKHQETIWDFVKWYVEQEKKGK